MFFKPQTEAENKKKRGRPSAVKDTAGSTEAGSAVSAETSGVVVENTATEAESALKVNLLKCLIVKIFCHKIITYLMQCKEHLKC